MDAGAGIFVPRRNRKHVLNNIRTNLKTIHMGMYDTYGECQLKVGECLCENYKIRDKANIPDGIYVDFAGAVVIKDGIFIAEFQTLNSKWGDVIDPETVIDPYHPLASVLNKITQTDATKNKSI